jgi:hypothetical protein
LSIYSFREEKPYPGRSTETVILSLESEMSRAPREEVQEGEEAARKGSSKREVRG